MQADLLVSLLLVAGAVSIVLGVMAGKRRSIPGAAPLAILALAAAVWQIGYAFELWSESETTKIVWAKIQYLGIAILPTAWVAVTLQHTGRGSWLGRRNLALLAVVPVATVILAATNGLHSLIWDGVTLDNSNFVSVLVLDHGAWFWVFGAYSYVLVILGAIFLADALLRSPSIYRAQAAALLVSALVPWATNWSYAVGLVPGVHLDLTPFAFCVSVIVIAWGLFRVRLLDVMPVARQAIFQTVTNGILVLDAQDGVSDCNAAAQRATGITSLSIGQPVSQVWPKGAHLTTSPLDQSEEYQDVVLGHGDDRHSYDVTVSPFYDGRGSLAGRIVAFHVSDRRRLAEETLRLRNLENQELLKSLQESNRQLEDTLAELRTTQQQVIQQERLRALGMMASGVAHDLNNTLSPIMAYSELLLSHPEHLDDRESLIRRLEIINMATRDAAEVVRRLKEFYRPRLDREETQPVDLNLIARQAMDLTQPKWMGQAQESNIDIQFVTDLHDVSPVNGNGTELKEVLVNLIINAVDAMPDGGTITISTLLDGDHVALRVGDTGIGMNDEVRRSCMEPFFTTKGERGAGLGLAVAFGIIQRHGGTIDIQSTPGQGTDIKLRLPISEALVCPDQKGASDDGYGRISVLVVEDEEEVRRSLAECLSSDGHTVESAATGSEGYEKFLHGTFDLVILDRAMPEMNGDQLAKAIKKLAVNQPVVMLTGFGDLMETSAHSTNGVDMVVGKPVTLKALRRVMSQVMAKRSNGNA